MIFDMLTINAMIDRWRAAKFPDLIVQHSDAAKAPLPVFVNYFGEWPLETIEFNLLHETALDDLTPEQLAEQLFGVECHYLQQFQPFVGPTTPWAMSTRRWQMPFAGEFNATISLASINAAVVGISDGGLKIVPIFSQISNSLMEQSKKYAEAVIAGDSAKSAARFLSLWKHWPDGQNKSWSLEQGVNGGYLVKLWVNFEESCGTDNSALAAAQQAVLFSLRKQVTLTTMSPPERLQQLKTRVK